jgi:hypothetical protein
MIQKNQKAKLYGFYLISSYITVLPKVMKLMILKGVQINSLSITLNLILI